MKPVVSMIRWRGVVLNRHLWGRSWRSETLRVRCDARRTCCVAANNMFLDKGHIGAVIEFMSYGMTFVDETLCSRLG